MNNQWKYDINQIMVERNLFYQSQNILIATSGGQDSMLLYTLLHRLHIQWKWKLGIIHCDHQWAINSLKHAKLIYKLTYALKSPLYLCIPVAKVDTEEKARNWRYDLMYQIAALHQYSAVAVGHTSSDRAETLLLNCFRGTSFDGIKSLQWKRTIKYQYKIIVNRKDNQNFAGDLFTDMYYRWFYLKIKAKMRIDCIELVRPLLKITRAQVQEQVFKWKIPICIDASNEIIKIRRNRIRHQLIPYLRKYFNPRIEYVLNGLAEIADYDLIYLNSIVKFICDQNIKRETEHSISLEIDILSSLPINMQRRVLKKFLNSCTRTSFNFENIESIRLVVFKSTKDNTIDKCNRTHLDYNKTIISLPNHMELRIHSNKLTIVQI